MDKKYILKSTAVSFVSQGVATVAGILSFMLLVRRLDTDEYSMWQMFLFCIAYAGLFQLGLCDGVYLRLGGVHYSETDKALNGKMFRIMTYVLMLVSVISVVVLSLVRVKISHYPALVFSLIFMPFFNMSAYLGYIFQATGHTVEYSLSWLIEKTAFTIGLVIAYFSGSDDFFVYGGIYILSRVLSLIYCMIKLKDTVFCQGKSSNGVIRQIADDIKNGIKLLIGNLSGVFTTGAPRLAVVWKLGNGSFADISFLLSLTGIFFQLSTQTSMVLFPQLRRTNENFDAAYTKIKNIAEWLLPLTLLSYIPLEAFVRLAVPKYAAGTRFIPILLVIGYFECKIALVYTTALKVKNKADSIMKINLVSAGLSLLLCIIAVSFTGKNGVVLLATLLSDAVRCILLSNACGGEREDSFREIILCLSYVSLNEICEGTLGSILFSAVYFVYVFVNKEKINNALAKS